MISVECLLLVEEKSYVSPLDTFVRWAGSILETNKKQLLVTKRTKRF